MITSVCMYVDTFLTKASFCRLVAYLSDASEHVELPPPTIWKPIQLWTGWPRRSSCFIYYTVLYVCMYVCMYVCVHHCSYSALTCIYICMYVNMYACVCRYVGKQVISLLVRPNSSAKSLVNLESEERFYT
jgi:hypothetical protein